MRESLTGHLVELLSKSFSVDWCLVAKTGATTAATLQHLSDRPKRAFDLCVTSLGVNDVTSGVALRSWLGQQQALRSVLRQHYSVRRFVICGLPPLHGFPALPQPLRWWLGAKATKFDAALRADIAHEEDASFLSLRFSEDRSLMAADGFHPGPVVYEQWARKVVATARLNSR